MTNFQQHERSGDEIFDESFLDVRAKLLEIAAVLDRIDRASDQVDAAKSSVDRRAKVEEAIRLLLSAGPDRGARLQKLFSREYESDWRAQMKL